MMDLFAGAGGLSLGLSASGFTPVAASEIDDDAVATYTQSHADRLPKTPLTMLHGDIAQHDFRRFRGNITLVAGGPPCQPYSLGGHRRGAEDDRDGVPHFVRAVREVQPEVFLMENVPGLAKGAHARRLDAILAQFREQGYHTEWKVLHAADYGVSQRRQRLFIIGTRRTGFTWPEPTHGPGLQLPWVPSRSVLDPQSPIGTLNSSVVTYARNPDLRPSPWDGHLWNGGGRPIDPDGLVPTLLASMGGNKTPWLDGGAVVEEYHAHLIRGGAARSGQVAGARRITYQEAARVQGFPDDVPWAGPISSRYRQIGNAVPVRLAAAVGSALRRHLDRAFGAAEPSSGDAAA